MSPPEYHGLTWDHPRGYNALAAAAHRPEALALSWDKQPLEGFESHPIADLCARYDLVVLDHPHVGEAVAAGCLLPLEDLFTDVEIDDWAQACVGPSLSSYRFAGRTWALPLDAATQVMAFRPERIGSPPTTWQDVLALAGGRNVALSLAGPHALLSFQSICSTLGFSPPPNRNCFMDRVIAKEAFAVMAALSGEATIRAQHLNPIAMLAAIERHESIDLCPLIYGYVNYATCGVSFADAPVGAGGIGSILGGTGIGISRRCEVTTPLLDHLRWLMSAEAQCKFIPRHDGQPALRAAWTDPEVNGETADFFAATLTTIEHAAVRPRHNGAIAFQTTASARLRAALIEREAAQPVLEAIEALYAEHHPAGAET